MPTFDESNRDFRSAAFDAVEVECLRQAMEARPRYVALPTWCGACNIELSAPPLLSSPENGPLCRSCSEMYLMLYERSYWRDVQNQWLKEQERKQEMLGQ